MLRPRNTQVLLKRDEPETETRGGILLPEAHRDWRSTAATVLAVGPKCDTVKQGDRVLVALYGGVEVRDQGELVALFPEADILAVTG